ncbi:MAG: cell wall metabolism sensor histidine kinase WalK [Clostridiales bacterium]|nr:cell wall metabolism sensor histidine kinase WalK [Clostridiales bacterium]
MKKLSAILLNLNLFLLNGELDTISRIKINLFSSIRWQILLTFLSVFVIAFYFMASSAINLVTNFLLEEKIRNDNSSLEQLSFTISPTVETSQSNILYHQLIEAGGQLQGRLVVVDLHGKVQADTFSKLNGTRLAYKEIYSILYEGKSSDYGVHQINNQKDASRFFSRINPWRIHGDWSAYSTVSLISSTGELLGVLLFFSSLDTVISNLIHLQDQIFFYFIIVASIILLFSLFFSQIITKPISALTKGIRSMGRGDFSTRVPVKGSKELRNLSETFNSMSEKLEALDNSRNQFISNASHELKTPLATMKIMLENLIYEPDMPKEIQTEFLTDVNKEIDRLNLIIGDLLTLVQMDTQNMKLNRETVALSDLLEEALHRLSPMAELKGHHITVEILDSGKLYADGAKLQQVIYNVLNNAIKYTQDNGKIHIKLQRLGPDFLLSIADNGPGIPKKDLPYLFDRFYRVDRARSRETGGTGLGLSIVNQIVLLHGGSVTVDSVEGQGSKFTIDLPAHDG